MNEQEKNTESTTTPTPEESNVETTTTEASEVVAEEKAPEVSEAAPEAVPVVETVAEVVEEKKEEVTEAAAEATTEVKEEVATTMETATKTAPAAMVMGYLCKAKDWVLGRKYTISAIALVIVAFVGLLYIMEEQGRIQTGIFDKVESALTSHKAVAKVNDGKVTRKQLETSVSQISAGAEAQGMDVTEPELAAQIQSQAIEMLVNTELLMQEAKTRGIVITDADIDERIDSLVEEVGGEEVLKERMTQFGIDNKTLRSDVRNELTIQKLLDEVFAEQKTEITDAEVEEFYESAGGADAGLPALEEVADQIKAQIQSTKEQEQVTSLIEELRGKATIEILI